MVEGNVAGACMPGGMHGGGGHVWQGGMHAPSRHHEIWSINAQVVCILLECILVHTDFILSSLIDVNANISMIDSKECYELSLSRPKQKRAK